MASDGFIGPSSHAPVNIADEYEGTLFEGTDGDDVILVRLLKGSPTHIEVRINDQIPRVRLIPERFAIRAGAGDDLIVVEGDVSVYVDGGDGDDEILSGGGDDLLFGGRGNDLMRAGDGNDYLEGGAGDDRLFGGGGEDRLLGNADHDLLVGGDADDYLAGGLGGDTILGEDGDDELVATHDDNSCNFTSVNFFMGRWILSTTLIACISDSWKDGSADVIDGGEGVDSGAYDLKEGDTVTGVEVPKAPPRLLIPNPPDLNRDGRVNVFDVIPILRRVRSDRPAILQAGDSSDQGMDINGDGAITSLDLLRVINRIDGIASMME